MSHIQLKLLFNANTSHCHFLHTCSLKLQDQTYSSEVGFDNDQHRQYAAPNDLLFITF
ncbi:Uncharacterized protein ChrSV_4410 [Chromobacterium vaccinii]|nr:Uncharacterized protein ChrSW_4410 [Chromobacterium vaccinii]QND91866.1 Uncharacterized protein ChrSV_4410 [Chromobacterium vaccinii]